MAKIRIAGIQDDSVVDGEGIRMTVFAQGCPHHCPGCHNPETWSFKGGHETTTDAIMKKYIANPLLDGITFSGGEPLGQPEAFAELADRVHAAGGNVWCYTGFTLEFLQGKPEVQELLNKVDVLVDGTFEIGQRDLTLQFRGSRNQRIWARTDSKSNSWEPWTPEKEPGVA